LRNLSRLLPEKTPSRPGLFGPGLLLLCIGYFAFEFYYIAHNIFSVDDFWLAYHTFHYKIAIPYRDFAPYKTVLGYYLLMLPMLVTQGTLTTLFAVKGWLVAVNIIAIACCGFWLKKFFSPAAALMSLALLLTSFAFLAYSTEIRVDLLAYWFCIFSLLSIFERRFVQAGCLIAVAFLISQKSLWCLLAMEGGLVASLGMTAFKPLVKFNFAAACCLSLYILVWASLSSFTIVMHSIFYEAFLIAKLTDYQSAIAEFWKLTLGRNFIVFFIWVFAWLSLWLPPQHLTLSQRMFIGVYSTIMAGFFLSYQQPFAYHLLVMAPSLLLLAAALCDWIFTVFTSPLARKVFCASLIASNFALALLSYLVAGNDNQYQRANLVVMEQLLKGEDNFIAGTPLIFNKAAIIPGLIHLTAPQLNYLYAPLADKSKYMLAALYTAPTNPTEILQRLQAAPIKCYINNNRIAALPAPIKDFLAREYQHFWGSIYLYAPTLYPGQQVINLKFDGQYKIEATDQITLDGKTYQPAATVHLQKGEHSSLATAPYRLQLQARVAQQYLIERFHQDNFHQMIG
jgi:hypothetical protein